MKKIFLICAMLGVIFFSACEEANIPDAPEYDKTEILSFKIYNTDKKDVIVGNPVINEEASTVVATVEHATDLSALFAVCGLSSGANIYPALGGYQDWSSASRQFMVVSASGSRSKQWTVTLIVAP